MRFSPAFLDKLKNSVKLSGLISKHTQLKKRGKDFFGLCPFHAEKTPSFSVNDDKKFYYCFGCGAHGEAIHFIQKMQNLSFPESVKYLAHEYNIPLPVFNEQEESRYKIDGEIFKINFKAMSWFRANLYSTKAVEALEYLRNRSIAEVSIKKFFLGYAPERGLLEHLKLSGYSEHQIKEAGLVKELEDGRLIDKFRNRVIFPILDKADNVIAFGGRSIFDATPKYLNSPATPVFHKKKSFYGENFAFKNKKTLEAIYIVEGYTDLIALHRSGVSNVVATLGTAISEEQIKRLWEEVNEPTICMDGDSAGVKAMARAADTVLPLLTSGFSINFVKLPQGQDPDDVIKNSGPQFMTELLSKKISLCEAMWSIAMSSHDITTPEKQALLRKDLLEKTNKINDFNVKIFYKKYFNKKISDLFYQNRAFGNSIRLESQITQVQTMPPLQRYELNLLAIIVEFPSLLKESMIFEKFASVEVKDSWVKSVYHSVLDLFTDLTMYDNHSDFDAAFKTQLRNKIAKSTFEHLCGNNTYFLDKISTKTLEYSESLWNKTFDYYNLEILKQEYKASLKNPNPNAMDIAKRLRQEIIQKAQNLHDIYD